jgi:3-oxoacyl-[acyl-carrier protein] reductase
MSRFQGQTVVVTGATRGIGSAISRAFLEQGAKVIGTYRGNRESADAFAASLPPEQSLELHAFDIADYTSVEAFFKTIEVEHPSIDVLVNNGGIRRDAVAAMMKESDWRAVIDTNLTGAYQMSKFAIQNMMRQRKGRIVNISSPMSREGFAGQSNYAASKAGLEGMTRSISKEVATRGITVNCVSPGFIDTELLSDLDDSTRKSYKKMVPIRRFGKPAEVAAAVLFLASEDAAYITGSVLDVAGGL